MIALAFSTVWLIVEASVGALGITYAARALTGDFPHGTNPLL